MAETRKLAAILVSDVVGYSRLAGTDEDRVLARLRALRSDLIDPTVAVHNGRVVKRTGDGSIVEFRSVVDAVRCAVEVQSSMIERNTGLPPERHRPPHQEETHAPQQIITIRQTVAAPTFAALTCLWRTRPQHHKLTFLRHPDGQ